MSGGSFARGDFVRITYCDQTVDGMVLIASGNGKSLMVGFNGALRLPSGGMCIGSLPVLMDDASVFRDLIDNQPVRIDPIARQ